MREVLLTKTLAFLNNKGFSISTYLHTNSCFDIAAKKSNTVFLLKVLSNIDALREEQAQELKRISSAFNAVPFVVGEKTKTFSLAHGVVYERYHVNCVSAETFKDLLENQLPEIKYFKGKKIVEIDSKKLKEKRKQLGFTLQEIAQKINSSAETLHRCETAGSASLESAQKLEQVLGENFVRKIDVLKPAAAEKSAHPRHVDEPFEKIEKLGFRLEFFSHAPFKAVTKPFESIYFDQTKRQREIKQKAEELSKTKKIVGGLPLIIAKDYEKESLQNVPVIREEELYSMSKKSNLLEMAKEREKHAKRKRV